MFSVTSVIINICMLVFSYSTSVSFFMFCFVFERKGLVILFVDASMEGGLFSFKINQTHSYVLIMKAICSSVLALNSALYRLVSQNA